MAKQKRVAQVRRRARELAAQLLYSMELRPDQNLDECLDVFIKWGLASEPDADEEVRSYMSFLVRGVWAARSEIDGVMRRIVTGWRLERMVAMDRALIRVAMFEGFLKKEVPVAVAISEAVDMAKAFGTDDSGKFVNGVLAKVLRFLEAKDSEAVNNEAASDEAANPKEGGEGGE